MYHFTTLKRTLRYATGPEEMLSMFKRQLPSGVMICTHIVNTDNLFITKSQNEFDLKVSFPLQENLKNSEDGYPEEIAQESCI